MRPLCAAMLLTITGEARAQAPDASACADMRLVIAAARADPPFATLSPRFFQQGHLLFGIAWPCQLESEPRALRCRQYVTHERQAEIMAEEIAHCLPEAGRAPDETSDAGSREGARTFPFYRARFRLPGLTIEVMRSGNPAHHLGQFVTYWVTPDPR